MLTFSLKYMILRKITIDNSVRYVKKSEQTKPNMIKNNSIPKKQSEQIQFISGGGKSNKNLSQNNRKFIRGYISASGFGLLK